MLMQPAGQEGRGGQYGQALIQLCSKGRERFDGRLGPACFCPIGIDKGSGSGVFLGCLFTPPSAAAVDLSDAAIRQSFG